MTDRSVGGTAQREAEEAEVGTVRKLKRTFTSDDLTAAAMTQTIVMADIPAGSIVLGVEHNHKQTWLGSGAISLKVDFDGNPVLADGGIDTESLERRYANSALTEQQTLIHEDGKDPETFPVEVVFTAAATNLDQFTGGEDVISVLYILPDEVTG